jgi:hypothetical protein
MCCHPKMMYCHDNHMTCCILCAPESARCVPDHFPPLGVGSGNEITSQDAHVNVLYGQAMCFNSAHADNLA